MSKETFNRTSLESKLARLLCCFCVVSLLIEPVWNRNTTYKQRPNLPPLPFNRTSLESKLTSVSVVLSALSDF